MNLPTSREVAFVLLLVAVVGVLAIVFGGRLW
jgi:hypothetical protein